MKKIFLSFLFTTSFSAVASDLSQADNSQNHKQQVANLCLDKIEEKSVLKVTTPYRLQDTWVNNLGNTIPKTLPYSNIKSYAENSNPLNLIFPAADFKEHFYFSADAKELNKQLSWRNLTVTDLRYHSYEVHENQIKVSYEYNISGPTVYWGNHKVNLALMIPQEEFFKSFTQEVFNHVDEIKLLAEDYFFLLNNKTEFFNSAVAPLYAFFQENFKSVFKEEVSLYRHDNTYFFNHSLDHLRNAYVVLREQFNLLKNE